VVRTARRRLRTIRRAAGAARDWDVFLDDLRQRQQRQPQRERPGFDCLAGYALGRRTLAQAELEAVCLEALPSIEDFVLMLLDAVRPPHGADNWMSLVMLGRDVLSGQLQQLEDAAGEDLMDFANLHRVRIEGKRLRYAMEVFADCFPAAFREELYPRFEAMQETLGTANDSHVAVGELTALREWMKRTAPQQWKHWQHGVNGLIRFHQRRLPQERRRFLKLWQHWRGPETTALWDAVLAGKAAAVLSTRS
jgi:CHAD domain-containing protein